MKQEQPLLLVDSKCHNAECPLWHPLDECLYWSDIPQGHLFRYHPQTKSYEQIYQGKPVGGFTTQADGSLILFKSEGIIEHWHEGSTTLVTQIPEAKETRFNDAIADPKGRVFSGTMATSERLGRLYRLDLDCTVTPVIEEVEIPNGIGFAPDHQQFYFTDSAKRSISVFNYDIETGTIGDRTILITTPPDEGVPDGLTVDAEGYIWSARWDGSHVFRYTPDGKEVDRIQFPAKKVSSITFGGSDYRQLFVTTAGGNNRTEEGTGAGAIFTCQPGVQGVPEFFSQIKI